jgi:hypothetical protein
MTNFKLIGAIALSVALATPAMAGGDLGKHAGYHHRYVRVLAAPRGLPVQDALRWGYGTGYRTFHTGFGGLYGDGNYPGNVYNDYNPRG